MQKTKDTLIDIRRIGSDFGFVDSGIAKIASLEDYCSFFDKYLADGCQAGMSYLERNRDKRADPAKLVPGARSVLCFLAPYGKGSEAPDGSRICGFAQGEDYHKVIKDRLYGVMSRLADEAAARGLPAFSGRPFTDSAPLAERAWAVRARLGFIGRNSFLISPEYGLRTLIGAIVCNIPAEAFIPHPPLTVTSCGECGKCAKACPTGALQPYRIDARRCISYHTVESHDALPDNLNRGESLFGCDRCLEACPWNKDIPAWAEFRSHHDRLESMTREDWRQLTPEAFEETFGTSSLTRAGLEKLKDNAR